MVIESTCAFIWSCLHSCIEQVTVFAGVYVDVGGDLYSECVDLTGIKVAQNKMNYWVGS